MDINQVLLDAIKSGYIDIVKCLVDNGADLRYRDSMAVRKAAEHGHLDILKYLDSKSVPLDIANFYGETALCYAANKGLLYIVKFLINKGADIKKSDYGALRYSIAHNHYNVVEFLINNINKPLKNINYELLYIASKHSNIQIIKLLIENGMKISKRVIDAANIQNKKLLMDPKQLIPLLCKYPNKQPKSNLLREAIKLNIHNAKGMSNKELCYSLTKEVSTLKGTIRQKILKDIEKGKNINIKQLPRDILDLQSKTKSLSSSKSSKSYPFISASGKLEKYKSLSHSDIKRGKFKKSLSSFTHVKNPKSGRWVKKTGKIGKSLLASGQQLQKSFFY